MDSWVYVGECSLGRGVFAKRAFQAGERLFTLVGPIITLAQTALMGEKEAYPVQIDEDRYIDPEPPGCYLNHSCNPNAGLVNGSELTAIRAIATHEEVRFDYSTTMQENRWTMVCRCGEPRCRKIVADFRLLPHDTKRHYLALGIVQDFILRAHSFSPPLHQNAKT